MLNFPIILLIFGIGASIFWDIIAFFYIKNIIIPPP